MTLSTRSLEEPLMMTCSHGLTSHTNCTDPTPPQTMPAPAAVTIGPPCQRCGVEVLMSPALLAQLPKGAPVEHPPGSCPKIVTAEGLSIGEGEVPDLTPKLRTFECEVLLVEVVEKDGQADQEEMGGYTIKVEATSFAEAMDKLSSQMTERWARVMSTAAIADGGAGPQMPAEQRAQLDQVSPAMRRILGAGQPMPQLLLPPGVVG